MGVTSEGAKKAWQTKRANAAKKLKEQQKNDPQKPLPITKPKEKKVIDKSAKESTNPPKTEKTKTNNKEESFFFGDNDSDNNNSFSNAVEEINKNIDDANTNNIGKDYSEDDEESKEKDKKRKENAVAFGGKTLLITINSLAPPLLAGILKKKKLKPSEIQLDEKQINDNIEVANAAAEMLGFALANPILALGISLSLAYYVNIQAAIINKKETGEI